MQASIYQRRYQNFEKIRYSIFLGGGGGVGMFGKYNGRMEKGWGRSEGYVNVRSIGRTRGEDGSIKK